MAGADRSTHCRFTKEVVLSPGFSMTPTSGTFTTNGQNGSIECDGLVAGHQPIGSGSIGTEGRYGTDGADTCTSGTEGTGFDTLTIPTAEGPRTLIAAYRFTAGEPPKKGDGVIAGRFGGDRFTGTFEAMPLKGDCLTSPVTALRVVGEGVLH
ncbi:MAG TPA: hypothetical protein VFS16_20005 [Acidimicrobiia bacterium]|nr:hypothetical protein [Acidimicrobiia bacterium]